MKKNKFFIFILFSLFLFFGCLDNTSNENSINESLINESNLNNINQSIDEEIIDKEANFVLSVSTDKQEYHSAQEVNVTIDIDSNQDINNTTLAVRGVNNRFKEDRLVNLTNGKNTEMFIFKLPRCNVCGGIREGNYDITATIVLNNITFSNLTTINVKQ